MKQLINACKSTPRKLLLVDGAGAVLSALLLGFIFPIWPDLLGIPIKALYFLASIPTVFIAFDLFWYVRKPKNYKGPLIGIALLNLSYCIISILSAIYHRDSLTVLGWCYFVLEVIVVIILVVIELGTAKS